MRRFFIVLFVVSLVATAGTIYWATYLPEKAVTVSGQSRSLNGDRESEPGVQSFRTLSKEPSDRQEMAVTISILSSIISAIAAVAQTWLTARSLRR